MIPTRPASLRTERKIDFIKAKFSQHLANNLNLHSVSAPLFVAQGTGFQDDLCGTERAISFEIEQIPGEQFEIVHSLAKWKRWALASFEIPVSQGIITKMHALRPDEESLETGIHSVFVDQWDWERVISRERRTLSELKETVREIYSAVLATATDLKTEFGYIHELPKSVTFLHSESLLKKYPDKSSQEREDLACREFGAVFIIGIGHKLSDGKSHDGRAPDYDDWSSENEAGFRGLNGDLIVWHDKLNRAFELSSMGIRVIPEVLVKQLSLHDCPERATLSWHKLLLEEKLPISIGGGIGQSRLCQFLLQKKHIGEVQASAWPHHVLEQCEQKKITIL